MKKALSILLIIMIFLTTSSSIAMATSKYDINLNINFVPNLLFSTYDVDLYINDQFLQKLPHGKDYSSSFEVNEGNNVIHFYKDGDTSIEGIINLDIKNNTAVKCTINCHYDEITISNLSIKTSPEDEVSSDALDASSVSISHSHRDLTIADGEIVFRNMPWGTTYEDAERALASTSYLGMSDHSRYRIAGLNDLVTWFPKINNKWYSAGKAGILYTPDFKVAGYDVDKAVLYFAFLPNTDGIINTKCDTDMFAAYYDINVPKELYTETIEDLQGKLSGLYGTIITTETEKNSDFTAIYNIWKGKNDSYVVLCDITPKGLFSNRTVRVVYASKAHEKYLDQAGTILTAAEEATSTKPPFENTNNDGL